MFLLPILISGCNVMGGPSGDNIKESIINRTPEVALKTIKFDDYGEGDSVLYYLEEGMLHKMAGQFDQSEKAFEAAKDKMEALYTASISKGVASVLVNDNTTDYEGEPFENIMAHVYQALDYLETGKLENAAVIARQLDTKLTQLSEKKQGEDGNVYKCDPYANYLSGLIFEALQDWGSARITYERAYNCYENSIFKIGVPNQLKSALVRSAKMSGANSIYRQYKEKFSIEENDTTVPQSELVITLDEGFVVAKRESSISITASMPNGIRQVKIAMPELPKRNPHLISEVRVKVNGELYIAERVQDLDSAARAALDERLPAIRARAVARAIKNQAVQKKASDKGGFLAQLVAVVATNVIEKADIRGWRSLPHTVWMSRTALTPGTYDIDVELVGNTGQVMNIKQYRNVAIENGQKKNLYLRWGATPPQNKAIKAGLGIIIL